ncbi:hypothetical protein KY345_00255, partial [Candidatus Woesearchaeota archaeon]|nr:hypothetical protein [Candidatus Woesearchaeota archaeon]
MDSVKSFKKRWRNINIASTIFLSGASIFLGYKLIETSPKRTQNIETYYDLEYKIKDLNSRRSRILRGVPKLPAYQEDADGLYSAELKKAEGIEKLA